MPDMSRIARMRQSKRRRHRKKKSEENAKSGKKESRLQKGKNGMKFNVNEIAKMLEQMSSKDRKRAMRQIKKHADTLGLDALLKHQTQKNHKPGCECCINEIFEKTQEMCKEIPKDTIELDSDGEIPDLVPMLQETPPAPKMSAPSNDVLLKLLGQNKKEEKVETQIESPNNDALLKLLEKNKKTEKKEEQVEIKIESPNNETLLELLKVETQIESPNNDALLKLLEKNKKTEKKKEQVEIKIESPNNKTLLELLKIEEKQKNLYDMRPNPPLTVLDILKQQNIQLPAIVEEEQPEEQEEQEEQEQPEEPEQPEQPEVIIV